MLNYSTTSITFYISFNTYLLLWDCTYNYHKIVLLWLRTEVCSVATVSVHQVCYAALLAASYQQWLQLDCQEASAQDLVEAGTQGWPEAALSYTHLHLLTHHHSLRETGLCSRERWRVMWNRRLILLPWCSLLDHLSVQHSQFCPLLLVDASRQLLWWTLKKPHISPPIRMMQATQSATRCTVLASFIKTRPLVHPLWPFNDGSKKNKKTWTRSTSSGKNMVLSYNIPSGSIWPTQLIADLFQDFSYENVSETMKFEW